MRGGFCAYVYTESHYHTYTHAHAHTQMNDTAHINVRVSAYWKLHPEMQRLAVVVGRLNNTVA